MSDLDRRRFLRLTGSLAAAALVPGFLAACAKKLVGNGESLKVLADSRLAAGAKEGLSVFLGGEDYISGLANYVAIGLVRGSGAQLTGDKALVWIAPTSDPSAKVAPRGPFVAPWSAFSKPEANPAPQGMNSLDLSFDKAGIWTVLVEAQGAKLIGSANIQVKDKTKASTRIAGETAIPSLTPTEADHAGVEPICTRSPQCDMHKITLKQAVESGKPTLFFVGTPRFCSSRTCGPNIEELIQVQSAVGDKANFIHAEVYKDDRPETVETQQVAPVFAEWGLPSDPWLFLIDSKGVIAKRFEGPFSAAAVTKALAPLLV